MPASEFSDVFVSYRRKDVEFVKKLVASLQAEGKEVWVDWEDIPPGVEGFADEIKRGLEGADTFIAVLSPDYLESTYCVDLELGYAVEMNKKIIPIVLKNFDGYDIPKGIGHINWIYFTPHAGQENTYEESFPKILDVLHNDLDHVKQHKRFLLRAIEWQENNKDRSFLLFGEEIENGQSWLADSAGKEPIPTELHKEYVQASNRNKQRQQRLMLFGISTALIVSVILSVLSLIGFNDASIAQSTAVANLNVASTAKAEAEANELIASTARANAENSAELAQTAQAEAETNEQIAITAQAESERNLKDSRQSQALFHGDLAQQQANFGFHQRALLLGLAALKFHKENITSDSAYQAIHFALHQPHRQIQHMDFPKGILDVIWHDSKQQTLIVADSIAFLTCSIGADCSPRVELWDMVTQTQLAYLSHDLPLVKALWNQDSNQVLTLAHSETQNQSVIRLWDIATQSEVYRLNIDKFVYGLDWETGHSHFTTIQRDSHSCGFGIEPDCNREIHVYDFVTGDAVAVFPQNGEIQSVHLTQDNRYIEILQPYGLEAIPTLYNLETGEPLKTYSPIPAFNQLEWRDDDTRIVTMTEDTVFSEIVTTGEILYSISSTMFKDIVGDFIVIAQDCETCDELEVFSSITGDAVMVTEHPETVNPIFIDILQGGKYLLTQSSDDSLSCADCETAFYLWSLETGQLLHIFDYVGWMDSRMRYDINSTETQLLTLSTNAVAHNLIRVWNIDTGGTLLNLDMDREFIHSAGFDNSEQHILINHGDYTTLYSATTGLKEYQFGHIEAVNDVRVLHDDNLVVMQAQTHIAAWEVSGWSPTLKNPMAIQIVGEAYDAKYEQVVTWANNQATDYKVNDAYVWDIETGQGVLTLETSAPVHDGIWSPDGKRIVLRQREFGCSDCLSSLVVFDAKTGEQHANIDGFKSNSALSWMGDTSQLIVDQTDKLDVIDIDDGEVVYTSEDHIPGTNEWSQDYTMFIDQNTVEFSVPIVSYPSNDIIQTIPLSTIYFDVDWVNDNQVITFLLENASQTATDVVGYDVASGEEIYRIENAGLFEESNNHGQLLVYTVDNQLHAVAADSGDIIWSTPTLAEDWTDIIWSPSDDMAILSGFFATRTQLFDTTTGEAITVLNFSDYRWSPDSRFLLALDDNPEIPIERVYDVNSDLIRFSFFPTSRTYWQPDSRGIVSNDGVWSVEYNDLVNRGELLRVRTLSEPELQEFFIKPPPDNPKELIDQSQDSSDDDDSDDDDD